MEWAVVGIHGGAVACTPAADPVCLERNENSFSITISTFKICFDGRDPGKTLTTECSLDTATTVGYTMLFLFGGLFMLPCGILIFIALPCTLWGDVYSKSNEQIRRMKSSSNRVESSESIMRMT